MSSSQSDSETTNSDKNENNNEELYEDAFEFVQLEYKPPRRFRIMPKIQAPGRTISSYYQRRKAERLRNLKNQKT